MRNYFNCDIVVANLWRIFMSGATWRWLRVKTATLPIHIYCHYLRNLKCHGVPTTAKTVNSEVICAEKHVYVLGPPRGFGNTLISMTRYLSIRGNGQWSINDHLLKDVCHLDVQWWGVNGHSDILHARICRAKLLVDRYLLCKSLSFSRVLLVSSVSFSLSLF